MLLILANVCQWFLQVVAWWSFGIHAFFLAVIFISFFTWRIRQVLSGEVVNPLKAKHDPNQKVWVVHGKRYDLTPWLDQHPGGKFALTICQGTDCTGLFETYHTFAHRDKQLKILQRFEIPESSPVGKDIEIRPEADTGKFGCPFHEDLKKMCRDHFAGKGKHAHKVKSKCMIVDALILIGVWYGWYRVFMYAELLSSLFVALGMWHLVGNVQHEASHFTYTSSGAINRLCSMAVAPFSNSITWHLQHVAQHHVFTNGIDDVDVHHFAPVMRVSKHYEHKWFMKFQPLLFLMLIWPTAWAHLFFVVPTDMLWGTTDPATGEKRWEQAKNIELFRSNVFWSLLGELMFSPFLACVIGFFCGADTLIKTFSCACLVSALLSAQFLFCTQVSHLQHGAFEETNHESWAKRQVYSSYDYNQGSKFWAFATGGLNMQALHHVLPCVSASHYIDMYPKFREVCKKHNVEIREYASSLEILRGFWAWILECSQDDLSCKQD